MPDKAQNQPQDPSRQDSPQQGSPRKETSTRGRTGYMTDHTGKPSSMRLLSALSMGVAILLTGLVALIIYQGQDAENLTFLFNLILIWIVGAFAPKTVQSFVEARFLNGPPPSHDEGKAQGPSGP